MRTRDLAATKLSFLQQDKKLESLRKKHSKECAWILGHSSRFLDSIKPRRIVASLVDKKKPQSLRQDYRFGSKRHSSIGTLKIKIPFSETHVIDITADVVNVNVPFLLGLEVLTKFKVLLDIGSDVTTS